MKNNTLQIDTWVISLGYSKYRGNLFKTDEDVGQHLEIYNTFHITEMSIWMSMV